MDGDQNSYPYYRDKICHFIQMNREDFEPFIVDKSFDEFLNILSKDGTYGGNECLVAFSRHFDAKICIHQVNNSLLINILLFYFLVKSTCLDCLLFKFT
jgi:hypothetical protein